MILITGAAGKTGRAVITALAGRGETVRALVRRRQQAAMVEAAGAHEAVVGDLRSREAMITAASGVRAIYHICPNMHPDEVAIGRLAIEAGCVNGVERFVYHSVLHPQTEAMPHHWHKLRVEEMLLASALPFTILQPAAYMQNILAGWEAITTQGIYTVPYPVTTQLSLVDVADVAEVAARALTERGHGAATYELVGTEPLAQTAVAEILSQALQRPVEARELSLAEWRQQAAAAGMDSYAINTLIKMFRYYATFDFTGNPRVLGHLLGREPTSLAAFLQRHLKGLLS
jgi:uncharacterized protein YbjT (DUF2867 family)